jgi:hypothetical protein
MYRGPGTGTVGRLNQERSEEEMVSAAWMTHGVGTRTPRFTHPHPPTAQKLVRVPSEGVLKRIRLTLGMLQRSDGSSEF